MCERNLDCGCDRNNCVFKLKERISIEEFYRRTRYCKEYRTNGECRKRKTDLESFVDFAELLWHPRAYMYKTALELLKLKKLAEEDTDVIPEELYKLIDRDMINGNREDIREAIRNKNTKAGMEDYSLIKNWARNHLWVKADKYKWRDEDEWQEIQALLTKRDYCESIDFESFRNTLDYCDHKRNGMLFYEEDFSEENSGNEIPAMVMVSLEDNTMTGRKTVDILLHDERSGKSIAVELKQWTENWIKTDDIIGFRVLGSDDREYNNMLMHPVIQAAFYAMLINSDEDRRTEINIPIPRLTRSELEEIDQAVIGEEEKAVRKKTLFATKINAYIDHIIANMPEDDWSCIPLVYLHNQYYYDGLLYKLAKKKGSPLYRLYSDCLPQNMTYYSMYTRHDCSKMLDIIKKWFNE